MLVTKRTLVAVMLLISCFCSTTRASDALKNDSRLDKKITLELGLVTLEELAHEISEQTGVKIEVGKGKSDWQVRERKTIVFVKDVPAREILTRVASLHHYRLSSYGDGTNRYYQIWQASRRDGKKRNSERTLSRRVVGKQ